MCAVLATVVLAVATPWDAAAGATFALAGKSPDDANFIAAWEGCVAAARLQGDRCLNLGSPGPAQARLQDAAIVAALQSPLAGLAVSVTHSGLLGGSALALARDKGVPVVTFDSDLEPAEQGLRRSHVGPDNLAFGRSLGGLVKAAHPQGGVVCLMSSDAHDPNLNKRLLGLRQALSGVPGWSVPSRRLQGEGGWREPSRCPWFNGDSMARAHRQMRWALETARVTALVSVGAWPLIDPARYAALMRELGTQRAGAGRAVFMGTGQVSAPQQALLDEGLIGGIAAIDFHEMGRQAYLTMKRLAAGERSDVLVLTGATLHTPRGPSP
jgi:ribose transport system substrate-binding protein